MAAFTSVISGNWNDGATWGLTSPGVKGTDWPGLAGDTATVAATHTVTYNVSETNQLGAVTVNGLLSFSTSMNTLLTLAHVDLTIGSAGELRIGTSGAPLLKTYTAEIAWATTADNVKGLYINSGGKLTIYGDPAYYGANGYKAQLSANWTTGQSFTVTGDYSGWNVGDTITVHKYALYSSYNTDVGLFTIASRSYAAGVTTITINEAAPAVTFNAGGHVNNASRNVRLSLNGAATTMGSYNSNRPRIYDLNAEGNNNCVLSNTLMTGFAGIDSLYGFQFLDSVLRNSKWLTSNSAASGHTVSGLIFSNGGANGQFYYGRGFTVSAEIYAIGTSSTNPAFYYPKNHTISGDIYACAGAMQEGVDCTITGNIYSCSVAVSGGANTLKDNAVFFNATAFNAPKKYSFVNCAVGYKPDRITVAANTYDFGGSGGTYLSSTAYGGKWPSTPNQNSGGSRGTIGHTYYFAFQDYNGTAGDHRVYMDIATLYRETTVIRSGGADNSIKVEPYSTLANTYNPIRALEWTENDVPASAQTRSVYMRGYGWSVFPTSAQLYLEAEYISNGTTYAHTLVASTAVLTDNTTWVEFPVSFTPAAVGAVRYRIYLKKYQASSGVYIDSKLNGIPSTVKWVDGWTALSGVNSGGGSGISRGRLLNSGGF